MAKKQPTERPVVTVAYKGILEQFKLYTADDGRAYITLPSGKRAYVEKRRDDTYIVKD